MNIQKILVIGAGGTGSFLLPPLARFLRSINYDGRIIIADGDKYEDSNSDRQLFSRSHIGKNKAEYQALAIQSQLGDMEIEIIPEYLNKEKINSIIEEETLVINCVDNLAARKFVEDRILELETGAHICCGNDLRHGNVQISLRHNNKQLTPSIYDIHPEFNSDNDDRSVMNCQDISDLSSGGQIIGANMMAASLAMNFVIQLLGNYPVNQNGTYIPFAYTYFDILTNSFESKLQSKVPMFEYIG